MIMRERRPTSAACLLACAALSSALLTAALVGVPARAHTMGILDPARLDTTDGRELFEKICQGCHMPDARGAIGAGHYPALARDSNLASRQYIALTVLKGRRGMPAFGAKHATGFGGPPFTLNEAQIAAVTNYVRTHFGNQYRDAITAAEVAALDQDRHN